MDKLLEGLNPAQKDAVTSPASVLQVLAPPGSGKTKTLTARVAYLINHERLHPWNIIVCTFTIKAAREMKDRIRGFVGDNLEAKLILGTFHSVARRFLARYGDRIGIPKNFGIADTSDSKAVIMRIIKRHSYVVEPGNARARISTLKSKGITAEQFIATTKKADQHEFACVYSEYEETLKASNLLDYDDLLLRCTELLRKHPECVSSIQAVLIDEYQDTNNVQYELMTLLAQQQKRITIVGDPDQSIYSFRSAEIKNLYRMRQDYPEAVVINLEHNYRSSGCILNSALALIEQDEARPKKPLLSTFGAGERPVLRLLSCAAVEAKWLVSEIQRAKTLTAGLLNFNDFAILLRAAALSRHIETALGKKGIPYRMVGGLRFFDRIEVKIVLDYLRVVNQPEHNDALARVINVPARGVGDVTMKNLLEEAESKKVSLWQLVLGFAQARSTPRTKISTQAEKGIRTFVNVILTSRQKLENLDGGSCSLIDLIQHVLNKTSLQEFLKKGHPEDWENRWANVEELVNQATDMSLSANSEDDADQDSLPEIEGVSQRKDTAADALSKFLANVTLSSAIEQPNGETAEQVTISTIHAAKGLEWPVVFIPAVYEGSIPHSRAEDNDEERRLLYVGMTRAQALLYMSSPVKNTNQEQTTLSRFVTSKGVRDLLDIQGPIIGFNVVHNLAQILRRIEHCPLEDAIRKARTLVDCPEDNLYPVDGSDLDPEHEYWDTSGSLPGNEVTYSSYLPSKRRKVEANSAVTVNHVSVTMQNSSNYSVSSTTVSTGGFKSAGAHMKALQEAESVRMLSRAREASERKLSTLKKEASSAVSNKTTKKRPPGQGSITSFLRSNSLPSARASGTPSLQRSSSWLSSSGALNDISNVVSRVEAPVFSSSASFSGRKPRNTPMVNKPRKPPHVEETASKRHVLLSSSPAKPDDLPPPGEEDMREENEEDALQSPTKPNLTVSSALGVIGGGFRPASTMHTTSMARVQGQEGMGVQRKTLGMRRSMQGWSVKSQQMPRPR